MHKTEAENGNPGSNLMSVVLTPSIKKGSIISWERIGISLLSMSLFKLNVNFSV